MAENEVLLWVTLAMIAGGALFAWVMKFPIWKGAVVIVAGIALSIAGFLIFNVSSQLANIALFVVGAAVAGSAIGFGTRETAWSIGGGLVTGAAAGFLIPFLGLSA